MPPPEPGGDAQLGQDLLRRGQGRIRRDVERARPERRLLRGPLRRQRDGRPLRGLVGRVARHEQAAEAGLAAGVGRADQIAHLERGGELGRDVPAEADRDDVVGIVPVGGRREDDPAIAVVEQDVALGHHLPVQRGSDQVLVAVDERADEPIVEPDVGPGVAQPGREPRGPPILGRRLQARSCCSGCGRSAPSRAGRWSGRSRPAGSAACAGSRGGAGRRRSDGRCPDPSGRGTAGSRPGSRRSPSATRRCSPPRSRGSS